MQHLSVLSIIGGKFFYGLSGRGIDKGGLFQPHSLQQYKRFCVCPSILSPALIFFGDGYGKPPSFVNVAFYLTFRGYRSEEHTSELQSRGHLVCRLLLEKKK